MMKKAGKSIGDEPGRIMRREIMEIIGNMLTNLWGLGNETTQIHPLYYSIYSYVVPFNTLLPTTLSK